MIGIYKITNLINNHCYVGLSNNIERRWKEHITPKNINNKKTNIAKAFRKYGIANFKFEVLEECSIEQLNVKEQYYIQILKPIYNMNKGGKGNLGHKLSNEFKDYLRKVAKQQWENKTEEEKKKQIKNNLTGPKVGHMVSEDTRDKLRKANLGKKQSLDTIMKRSRSNKGKLKGNTNGNKKVAMLDIETLRIIKTFESVKAAAKYVGARPEMISVVLKGKRNKTKGYKWKYL